MLANERQHIRRLCDAGEFGIEDELGYVTHVKRCAPA
jgi:hypothetical protein